MSTEDNKLQQNMNMQTVNKLVGRIFKKKGKNRMDQ